MAGYIDSPHNDSQNLFNKRQLENPDFTALDSFLAPGGDHDLIKATKNTKKRPSTKTPGRQVFGDRTNRARNEFTPLLKSVQKNAFYDKINAAVQRTPSLKVADSSVSLPNGHSSGMDSSGYQDENTPLAPPQAMNSSEVSTPLALVRGKGGVLDDGALTLREQEKIIDDIKKENFSLKLKIYFLDDRLSKLGPEFNDIAIKENVELRVEQASLRNDMKRYKKSLIESEKALAILRQEMTGAQDDAKQRYTDSKQMEKNSQELEDLKSRLAQREEDFDALHDECERLKLEVEDRNKTEMEDATEIERLQARVTQLEDEKGDIESELRAKEEELDRKNEVEENDNEELKQRVEELEEQLQTKSEEAEEEYRLTTEDNKRLQNDVNQLQEEVEQLDNEVQVKEQEKLTLVEEYDAKIEQFEQKMVKAKDRLENLHNEKQTLRAQIATFEEERDGKDTELSNKVLDLQSLNQTLQDKSREVDQQLDRANKERQRLQDELAALKLQHKEELSELRENIKERSLTMKSRVHDGDELRQRLQREIDTLNQNLTSVRVLHEEKNREANGLRIRVDELTNNFNGDAKSMQLEITNLRTERDRINGAFQEALSQKDLLQLRHDSLTTESLQLQKDLQKAQDSVDTLKDALEQERHQVNLDNQTNRAESQEQLSRLEEDIAVLQAALDKQNLSLQRQSDDWQSEKRQLEFKLAREETKARGLETTIGNLRNASDSAHGNEMKYQVELANVQNMHKSEVESLNAQIRNLQGDMQVKSSALDRNTTETQSIKDELRQARKTEKDLDIKVKALEDEVEYLTRQYEEDIDEMKHRKSIIEEKYEKVQAELKSCKDTLGTVQTQLKREQSNLRTFQEDLQTGTFNEQNLQSNLDDAERRLTSMQKDKQGLQDQLSKVNEQMRMLKNLSTEVEIERDELKNRVSDLTQQVGTSLKLDQEKLELRKANGKLQIELRQMINDREELNEKAEELELQLEAACDQAVAEENRLENMISDLQSQVKSLTSGRESDKARAKEDVARFENKIQALLDQLDAKQHDDNSFAELSMIKQDLATTRKREAEMKQKETTSRNKITELRQQVQSLENDLHEARMARPRSPNDTQAQIERQELHQHLIKARLQIEELEMSNSTKESEVQAHVLQEKEFQARIKNLRQERIQSSRQAKKRDDDLEKAQQKVEKAQQKYTQLQQAWEEERKNIARKLSSQRTSDKDIQKATEDMRRMEMTAAAADHKHRAEIKGLAKQIQYLRAKNTREENFRKDLCFTKNFFLMQINLYGACNEANLQLLKQMGISPDRRIREKRPTLRCVGHTIIAAIRMRNRQQEWSVNENLKMALVKGLEQVRRKTATN